MVDVRKVLPDAFDHWGLNIGYKDLYKQFGTPLVEVEIGSYSGDTLVVLENEGKYGYLTFGWGSCSGCDALQGCKYFDDLQALSDHLENSIRWFDSKDELKTWVNNHDWKGDYFSYGGKYDVIDFICKANLI